MPLATSRIALHPHVPAPRRQASPGTVAIKEALLQHPASSLQAMLELAVRHNDIPTARHALQQGANPEHLTASPESEAMRILLTWARRQNLFYPPNLPQGKEETDLDHALRNMLDGDVLKEAYTLLEGAKQGKKNYQEVWRDAVKENRLDIQRAILLLYADRDRKFRLLELKEYPVTDTAVAKVLKEIPHFSPKRGEPQSFNNTAAFHDNEDKKIVCRHLAVHRQAVQEKSSKLKFDYAQYKNEKKIAASVSYGTQAKYQHIKAHATETCLLHNRNFGKTLIQQLAEMTRKDETTRLILLESTSHTMSVGLKIKEKKDGKSHYVVELFDPNYTTSHVRMASDNLRSFEALTLGNFSASEKSDKDHYPEPDDLSIMFVRPSLSEEQAMENPASCTVENRTLTSSIDAQEINATALWHMLANGFPGDLRRLKNEIASRPEKERIQLLAAENVKGAPGLFMALYRGHTDAIKAFGELLELVPPEERAKLLAVKPDGISGLAVALEMGHLKALDQYIEIVKKTALDLKHKDRAALLKYIRKSHAVHKKGIWWVNHPYYDSLKKNNPEFYSRFKEMKNTLKS